MCVKPRRLHTFRLAIASLFPVFRCVAPERRSGASCPRCNLSPELLQALPHIQGENASASATISKSHNEVRRNENITRAFSEPY